MISGFSAKKRGAPLAPFQYKPRPLGPFDVEIRISHCGLCHSDIHLIDNDWGLTRYPLVPGHEIIGTVVEKGPFVNHLKKGQRVGVGWQRGACFECEFCLRGDENLCEKSIATCVGHHGGFAEAIRLDGRFAFPLPPSLPSEKAAPLLCGGLTVYAPLRTFGVTPSMSVGVLGIGGLGHLALRFASTLGCDVAALSSSADKEEDARRFGATRFLFIKDKASLRKAQDSFDFILSTVAVDLDWAFFMKLLRSDGKLCFLGVPQKPVQIPPYVFIDGRKSLCGSPIGGRVLMKEMLTFAARHDVLAETETLPMPEINKAIQKVRRNKARFRMVLTND